MELYYKDLISEEASLEKLVDDLLNVVQGVEDFAQAAGTSLEEAQRHEVTSRLEKLKEGCARIRQHAVRSALATDKLVHQYPYSFAGFVFAFGLVTGVLAYRFYNQKRRD